MKMIKIVGGLTMIALLAPLASIAEAEIPQQVFKTEMKESVAVKGDTTLFYDVQADRWSEQGDGMTGNIYYPEEMVGGSAPVKTETDTLTSGIFVPIEELKYRIKFYNVGALGGDDYKNAELEIEYTPGAAYRIQLKSAEEVAKETGLTLRDDNREQVMSHMDQQIREGRLEGEIYRKKISASAPEIPSVKINMIFSGGPFGSFSGSTKGNGKDVFVSGEIYNDASEVLLKPAGGSASDYIAAGLFHLYPHNSVHVRIPIEGDGLEKWFLILKDDMGECSDPENSSKDSGVRFSDLWGSVEVAPCNGIVDEEWYQAELGDVLHVEDHIKTGRYDSGAVLSLSDMTTFKMRPATEIVLSDPPGGSSKISMVAGKVWANLKSIAEDGSMEVEMSQAVLGIKGTTWVMEDDGDTSSLKVIEGEVEFRNKNTGQIESVAAGEAIIAYENGSSEKVDFDTQKEDLNWEDMNKEYEQGVEFGEAVPVNDKNNTDKYKEGGSSKIIYVLIILILIVVFYLLLSLRKRSLFI